MAGWKRRDLSPLPSHALGNELHPTLAEAVLSLPAIERPAASRPTAGRAHFDSDSQSADPLPVSEPDRPSRPDIYAAD